MPLLCSYPGSMARDNMFDFFKWSVICISFVTAVHCPYCHSLERFGITEHCGAHLHSARLQFEGHHSVEKLLECLNLSSSV